MDYTISLFGIDVFAYHGCSEEEQKLGNRYTVDINLYCKNSKGFLTEFQEDDLSQTCDYGLIYKLVEQEMRISRKLLETLGQSILEKSLDTFNMVYKAEICISKHNPPIGSLVAKSSIKMSLERNN